MCVPARSIIRYSFKYSTVISLNPFTPRGHWCPVNVNACIIFGIFHILYLFWSILRKPRLILWHFAKKLNCSPFSYISVLLHIGYFRDLLTFNSAILILKDCNQENFLIYFWILCHVIDHHINFHDFLSHRKEFIVTSVLWDSGPSGWEWKFFKKIIHLWNELFLLHRGNFWEALMKNESKIIQKLLI